MNCSPIRFGFKQSLPNRTTNEAAGAAYRKMLEINQPVGLVSKGNSNWELLANDNTGEDLSWAKETRVAGLTLMEPFSVQA